ncbi:putative pyridoxal kinase [Neophaeococcomyces mojaviensis]|uniref:Pyridoxal kinase n=1 Tax=Neophaeococcomyces mojaviensis TaxID=3383035 RepID=A0ACC3ACW1_9EURO|nr:putative pyridoxal kinase [Knufia sp. JES_112]
MSNPNGVDQTENPVPETKVLAVASHVVYGYVGNVMATFCMQALGCEVAAINTVNFSNHTGYRQFKGTRTPPEEIRDLYKGLTNSYLLDFDVLLSGYIPSAEALHEVALIARDLKTRREVMRPGSFFWILDPVMGDQGRLYVSEELVKGYKSVMRSGQEGPDLIVPNGFELELISGVHLSGSTSTGEDGAELERRPTGDNYEATLDRVKEAIEVLHKRDGIRMIVATSVRIQGKQGVLCVVGSEKKSDGSSRCFVIEVPVLDCYFSGTGDMFAGLMVGRLREACQNAGTLDKHGWASDDDVSASELPLAKATVKVLSSMGAVLEKTMKAKDEELEKYESSRRASLDPQSKKDDEEKRHFLAKTKAAEVRAVRNAGDLIRPNVRFEAVALD